MNFDFILALSHSPFLAPMLAASGWVFDMFFYLAMILFIFVAVILTLLVLIQKGRGGGLAGAFGGAGGNTAFGIKTGDVLTWATSVVFLVFLVLAIALNRLAEHKTTAGVANSLNQPAAVEDQKPTSSSNPSDQDPLKMHVKMPSTVPSAMPSEAPLPTATHPAALVPLVPATTP